MTMYAYGALRSNLLSHQIYFCCSLARILGQNEPDLLSYFQFRDVFFKHLGLGVEMCVVDNAEHDVRGIHVHTYVHVHLCDVSGNRRVQVNGATDDPLFKLGWVNVDETEPGLKT